MVQNNNEHKNNKTLLIVLFIVMGLLVVLGVMYFLNHRQMEGMINQMSEEKEILIQEYQNLGLDFDSLKTNSDTLNILLENEREKISQLLEEIKTVKATNASRIREMRKQLSSMQKVLKSYVVQIDSLNRRNIVLTAENRKYKSQVTSIKSSYKELETVKAKLEETVQIASKLEIRSCEIQALNKKSRDTRKASKTSKIKVCFVLQKNITAKVGEKVIFMRILRPDGVMLLKSLDDLFSYEGETINFSAKRIVEYGGEDLDVCIYYSVDEGELLSGDYTIDLFADGVNVGTCEFDLK